MNNPKEFLNEIHEEKYIKVELKFNIPQSRCCLPFTPYKEQEPIIFCIPYDSNLTIYDWIPHERPKEDDNFFGVNRHKDEARLAGLIYHETNDFHDSFYTAQALMAREGECPDLCIVPEDKYEQVKNYKKYFPELKIISSNIKNELHNEILFITTSTWIKYPNTLVCNNPIGNLRLILKDYTICIW